VKKRGSLRFDYNNYYKLIYTLDFMEPIYEQIWGGALPYQDKRDDKGHAKTVKDYAIKLLETEQGNEEIVIPAAILHDIGWSQMSKEERMSCFKRFDKNIRIKHQKLGVKLAKKLLEQIDYNPKSIEEILEIIDGHDIREGFLSQNDGIVRDADKLWRYSEIGFWTDHRKISLSKKEHYETLKKNIDAKNFFYLENSREIARKELGKREKEIFEM